MNNGQINLWDVTQIIYKIADKRSKNEKIPEDFYIQIPVAEKAGDKIFKINAQGLLMDTTISDDSQSGSTTPNFQPESTEPRIPGEFKSEHYSFPIKGTESKEDCKECNGTGKFDCQACNTKGSMECPSCRGQREVRCSACKGSGEQKCGGCGGRGTVYKYDPRVGGNANVTCNRCNGAGRIKCGACYGKGFQTCNTCRGQGFVSCDKCNGKGNITCEKCDGSRFTWFFKKKLFQFNPVTKTYIVIPENMNLIEQEINDLSEGAWVNLGEKNFEELTGKSPNAKVALSTIAEFDKELETQGKPVKKRNNAISTVEGIILNGKYRNEPFSVIIGGNGAIFAGIIRHFPSGMSKTYEILGYADMKFSSMELQKELKNREKNEKELKKDAEKFTKEEAEKAEKLRKEEAKRAEKLQKEEAKRAEKLRKEEAKRAEKLRKEEEKRAEKLRKEEAKRAKN